MDFTLRKSLRMVSCIILMCAFHLKIDAAPAYPRMIKFRQPDGQYVNIMLHGDEYYHYGRTEDGYSLLLDTNGYFVYAMKDSVGNMICSPFIATDIAKRDVSVNNFLNKTPKQLTFSKFQVKNMNEAIKKRNITSLEKNNISRSTRKKVIGDRKVLVILVNFNDKKFSCTRDDFDRLINQSGYTSQGAHGSVNDYYKEVSGGQLNLIGDVVGPYTLSRDMAYYGKNIDGYANDVNPQEMAREAVALADADVDFSQYDSDNDGVIDGVHIIYAGYGEEAGGGGDCIWAHKWVSSGECDGVRLREYSCSPELRGNYGTSMTHIGVICHELGHVLGCMDYYDTNYSTDGQYCGTGQWDIMGNGNWNNDGASPANFNPYVRSYDFGWHDPVVLDTPWSVSISPGEQTVYRLDTKAENEFFLLENRQKTGFDSYLPGHGLMVYRVRVDANGIVTGNSGNVINSTYPQNMYPINAGSTYILPNSKPESFGDIDSQECPFPGVYNKASLSDETMPSIRALNGLYTDRWIANIIEDNGTISFDFDGGSGNPSEFTATDVTSSSITLTWNPYDKHKVMLLCSTSPIKEDVENREYLVNEILPNGNTKVLYLGNDNTFIHTGLVETTTYYYRIHTLLDDNPVKWSKGTKTSAETCDSSNPQYIFMENFNTMDWEQQIYQGGYKWKHDMDMVSSDGTRGAASWHVTGSMNQPSGFDLHSSMLISPQINLSRAENSLLTFDYCIGNYEKLYVYYRLSNFSEWELLETHTASTNGWLSSSIELPKRSETVQIGFQAIHNIEFGSTLNEEEAFIEIDNVGIASAYKAFAVTMEPIMISNTKAMIPVKVYEGNESMLEYGIEVQNGSESLRFASSSSDTIAVTGLTPGASYMYRSYVQTESDMIYGDEKQLTTVNWSSGEGTVDSPFLISTENDLARLSSEVANGQDFKNIYIMLTKDIEITSPLTSIGDYDYTTKSPLHAFNGVFDGNGNTILNLKVRLSGNNINTKKHSALFGMIGRYGVVKHLNIAFDKFSTSSGLVDLGVVACSNMGAIVDCHTYGNDICVAKTNYVTNVGTIATFNYGIVASCSNKININGGGVAAGGIVGTNFSVIRKCVNYGNITSYGSGDIGGISGYGSLGSTMPNGYDRSYNASIVDCINYGDISFTGDGDMFTIGGIAGTAFNEISMCVNHGNINVTGNDYNINVGGIVGDMGRVYLDDSRLSNCLNTGNVTVNVAESTSDNVSAGGICGTYNLLRMNNCCFTGSITCYGDIPYGAIIPDIEGATAVMHNCFYSSNNIPGNYGESFIQDDAVSVVDKLNADNAAGPWYADNGISLCVPDDSELYIGEQIYVNPNGYTLPIVYEDVADAQIEIYGVTEDGKEVFVGNRELEDGREFDICNVSGLEPGNIYKLRINAEGRYSAWRETATSLPGSGTELDPFCISSLNNIRAMALLINTGATGSNNYFKQTASINLQTDSMNCWQPIGCASYRFEGFYDGNGYSLTNMYVGDDNFYAGLFGYVFGSVRNVSLVGNNIVNSPHSLYAGGLIGYVRNNGQSKIESCLYHGDVIGNQYVGGMFGYVLQDVYYCGAVARLSGNDHIGGIAGDLSSDVYGSYAASIAIKNTVGSISGMKKSFGRTEYTYYQTGDNIYESQGEGLSKEEMTSDVLIDNINCYGRVWTRDISPSINDGYPILVKSTVVEPNVITGGVELNEDGTVSMHGTCFPLSGNFNKSGFEWRVMKQTTVEAYQESVNESSSPIDIIVSINCNKAKIAYRAFADIDGKRIYGEEKSFDYDILASIENNYIVNDKPYTANVVNGHIFINSGEDIDYVSVSAMSGIVYDKGKQTKSWKSCKLTSGIYIIGVSVNGRLYSEKIFVQ